MTAEETDEYRRLGKDGPFRNRAVEENLDLLERMKAGEFPDGARTLRARIDMQAPNVWLRDPVLYRIRHAAHHQTGEKWCIYPTYDFAHGLSDYLEGITHSLCTLEFEVHRPLYDWILEALDLARPLPHQYEFARLNLTYTVMSKRKLKQLVDERAGQRLGRSASADHLRDAATRRDRERAARFCLPHWDHEISVSHRGGRPRVCDARRV